MSHKSSANNTLGSPRAGDKENFAAGYQNNLLRANFLALLVCVSSAFAQAPGIVRARYQFRLIHGHGLPVCDAFLTRLQITKFKNPPYCGIPESEAVPGFARLNRVPLTEGQVIELYPRVFSFTFKNGQDVVPQQESQAEIRRLVEGGGVIAWRYSPKISIDNNRKQDNVVVWQGSGIFNSGEGRCGQVISAVDPPDGARSPQVPLILSADNRRIDERRTRELLGNPVKNPQLAPGFANLWPQEFVPLGTQIGFLLFRDTYYIYAFDGTQLNQPLHPRVVPDADAARARERLLDSLTIFVRRDATIRAVCSYHMGMRLLKGY